ncbi:cold-regulated protein 28-like isoform X1 [Pistacia vera]|uniref:cold-regulated protein 28-like isoform X1 n=1 Tax=Pistacia vera TaxID=55513 RepID=UPI0012634AE2|nr:cold-regulated protein 28-like isoform X1 [Pistacia vera]
MEDGCRSELTRSNSESSDITVESSYQYPNETVQGQSAEWTNEKHNAYIRHLEASFVQQLHELHCSTGFQGYRSQETRGPYTSQTLSAHTRFSPHQLMVLPDGCWQKNKLTEEESLFESTADSHGTLESPGIRRFTTVGKLQTATSFDPQDHSVLCDEGYYLGEDMTFSAESAGCSGQHQDYHLCHQNSVGSTTEDKPRNMARRSQTTAFDDPKSDQVLPRSGTQYFLRGS